VPYELTRRSALFGSFAFAGQLSNALAQNAPAPNSSGSTTTPRTPMTPTEQLLHTTVMIRSTDAHGATSSGTAFIFNLFNHADRAVPVLVTNKHVIKDAAKGFLRLTRKKSDGSPDFGNIIPIEVGQFKDAWIPHPDPRVDLAILPCAPMLDQLAKQGTPAFYIATDPGVIPTDEAMRDLTPLEDVLIVGYPDGISDVVNNVPIFRRGITATPPYLDFEGRKEFLIDAAIFPGSSGSPVFLFNQGTWVLRSGATVAGGYRIQLLGVVYGVATHPTTGEIGIVPAPTQRAVAVTPVPNNIGACVKAARILDFEPLLVRRGFAPPEGYVMRSGGASP
jgi:hypothetical protein